MSEGLVALIDCTFSAGTEPDGSNSKEYHVVVVTSLKPVIRDKSQKIIDEWVKSKTGTDDDFSSASLCTYIIKEKDAMAIEMHNLELVDKHMYKKLNAKLKEHGKDR